MEDTALRPSTSRRIPGNWLTNLVLFLATVASVFWAGYHMMVGGSFVPPDDAAWWSGWPFAVPFLLILIFHEFGHWIAAQLHRVPASLPYFLPVPVVWFGTMGAIITMPERIRSRSALLDIGAAGPLAGMMVAIPTMIIGLRMSEVAPLGNDPYIQEGQSLLYVAVKWLVLGPIPAGWDVHLHPTAFAAWGGFLITMINLLPWGQLDGGHIAYALLGEKQNKVALWVRRSLLALFAYNVFAFSGPLLDGAEGGFEILLNNATFWLVWFFVTGLMARFGGTDHPPCDGGALTPGRRRVAVLSLLLFVLLFMPTPVAIH